MDYLTFAIEVSEQADGRFAITVQTSPVGEVSVVAENPFTADETEMALAVFGRERSVTKLQESQAARKFGQKLFDFLIRQHQDINAAYFASLDRAKTNGLRIRLSVEKAGALADLPWELVCDPNRDFLALSRSTPVVRYTQMLSTRPPVPVTMPLRVLVMISAPQGFAELDVEGEWQRLLQATTELRERGLIELERLDEATLIALQRQLRAEDYHVFHYIGHSAYDETTQQGLLVLESEGDDQQHTLISGAALSRELGEESTIRLVILNSCQSARRNHKDPFAGIASGLVQRGIPAVVAMQFPISDGAAQAFAEEFYRVIAEATPIDAAMSEARRAIANRLQNTEWATPVLYMRSDSGTLFRPTAALEPQPQRRPMPFPTPALALIGVLVLVLIGFGIGAWIAGQAAPPPTPTDAPTPGALPNLQISGIRISPERPAPGQAFRLLISIRNAGEADSGPFSWAWDASPTLRNALDGTIENIPPGASRNISFPYSYGWWGSYSSQILVDVDSEVAESDERDNREAVIVELDPTRPLEIDFTFLPPNEIVVPPRPLTAQEFLPWNLSFGLGTEVVEGCGETSFAIMDLSGDNVLTAAGETPSECLTLPLVTTARLPVANVQAEVIPTTGGSAQLMLYGDRQGTALVGESDAVTLQAGRPTILSARDVSQDVRRAEIVMDSQQVNLTRLVLFPVVE